MEMPQQAGLYNVRLKRTSPHAREFLDFRAWYLPSKELWLSEDGRQIVGTSRKVTARCNGVGGWEFWKCAIAP